MPLFIVGFPRSGTTLAQKLVSQHLGIPTLPETHFFEFLNNHEPAGGHLAREAAGALVAELGTLLEVDVAALEPLLQRDEVPIRALFLHLVGQQIGSQAQAIKGQWIEKTPGHAEHLERIHQMFPKARFLCMVRNPLHVFASRRELQQSGKGWGEEWKPIEAFCAPWAQHVRRMHEFAQRHPGQMLILRLEDLAGEVDAQLRRVRKFVGPGLPKPATAPITRDIFRPFETWKRDALKPADPAIAQRSGKLVLDDYERWRVQALLKSEMALLGYPTDPVGPAGLDELHRKLVTALDWYGEQFARRDALMDVKTARIRALLNDAAERTATHPPEAAEPGAPDPATATGSGEAGASAQAGQAGRSALAPGGQGRPGGRPIGAVAASVGAGVDELARRADTAGGLETSAADGSQAGNPGAPGLLRGPPAAGDPRAASAAAARPAPVAGSRRADQVDDEVVAPVRPVMLRGISGVNDNAAEFFARISAEPAPRRGTDADDVGGA